LKANDAFTICFKHNYLITIFKFYACLPVFLVAVSLIHNKETQLNLWKNFVHFLIYILMLSHLKIKTFLKVNFISYFKFNVLFKKVLIYLKITILKISFLKSRQTLSSFSFIIFSKNVSTSLYEKNINITILDKPKFSIDLFMYYFLKIFFTAHFYSSHNCRSTLLLYFWKCSKRIKFL
jgi:hypothetical protein